MEKVYKLIGVWWLMFIKIGLHLSVVFNDGVMGFIKGIQVYGEAWKILFSRQFRYFLWFPVLILAGLFFGGNWLINELGNGLYGLAEPVLQEWINGISWLQWMGRATEIVIKVILRLLYFFLFISFGGYLLLVVMSPVYSWLSERAEVYLTGRDYPFSWLRSTKPRSCGTISLKINRPIVDSTIPLFTVPSSIVRSIRALIRECRVTTPFS